MNASTLPSSTFASVTCLSYPPCSVTGLNRAEDRLELKFKKQMIYSIVYFKCFLLLYVNKNKKKHSKRILNIRCHILLFLFSPPPGHKHVQLDFLLPPHPQLHWMPPSLLLHLLWLPYLQPNENI